MACHRGVAGSSYFAQVVSWYCNSAGNAGGGGSNTEWLIRKQKLYSERISCKSQTAAGLCSQEGSRRSWACRYGQQYGCGQRYCCWPEQPGGESPQLRLSLRHSRDRYSRNGYIGPGCDDMYTYKSAFSYTYTYRHVYVYVHVDFKVRILKRQHDFLFNSVSQYLRGQYRIHMSTHIHTRIGTYMYTYTYT